MMTVDSENTKKINLKKIFIKVIIIVLLVNFGWILVPDAIPANLNIYNWLITGRERLPFGENSQSAYNLGLYNLDAMFKSHTVSDVENKNSYRVFLIGDSSIWGYLQQPEQTLSGLLQKQLDGKNIEIYNLGYPSISILKDALIIDHALQYQPDLIVWFTTLEALPTKQQLSTPIIENNFTKTLDVIKKYNLSDFNPQPPKILNRTFWGQRRNIFDVIRLQLYGFLWDATGVDQEYPESYREAQRDFPDPVSDFYGINDRTSLLNALSFDIIQSVIHFNQNIDFLLVNEPILVSEGENSQLQYNFYYPRWAYDTYRDYFNKFMQENGIEYYDFWDLIPENEFTNSAIHLSPDGEQVLAEKIKKIILDHIGD